jgi:hypothetical protein
LGGALAAVWTLLWLRETWSPEQTGLVSLALTCIGAAVTVMYSGYATGGQLGIPLAGALLGVAVASQVVSKPPSLTGAVGIGIVGLFALLVVGRFFAVLTTTHAILLLTAPLLCWLTEIPSVRKWPAWERGLLAVALVSVPLAVAVIQAQQKFVEDSHAPSQPGEPSSQDYQDFGK